MPHKNKIALRWLIVAILVTQLACQTVMEFLPSSGTPTPDEGREATAEVPEAPAAQATAPAPRSRRPAPRARQRRPDWRARVTMATASRASTRRSG